MSAPSVVGEAVVLRWSFVEPPFRTLPPTGASNESSSVSSSPAPAPASLEGAAAAAAATLFDGDRGCGWPNAPGRAAGVPEPGGERWLLRTKHDGAGQQR